MKQIEDQQCKEYARNLYCIHLDCDFYFGVIDNSADTKSNSQRDFVPDVSPFIPDSQTPFLLISWQAAGCSPLLDHFSYVFDTNEPEH